MNQALKVAQIATKDIETWLSSLPETIKIQNVENNPEFQTKDIDLLWQTKTKLLKIEIKGDRYHKTGNFFFETHSNFEKNTPGCFIYTEADWIFYYFITSKILYTLPMPNTRHWFLANIHRFREKSTTTSVRETYYTTVGRLVPISVVTQEVSGIRKYQLT